MKVAVGSKNPAKIEAVRQAFAKVWSNENFKIISVTVDSGVSNQPMSYSETIKGARNRAHAAREKTDADYGVGLEGGIDEIDGNYFGTGFIVIVDKNNIEGIGSSVSDNLSKRFIKEIKNGKELDEVDVLFFGDKYNELHGHFGLMTKNALTRTEAYRDGVIMALIRFLHPDLYE